MEGKFFNIEEQFIDPTWVAKVMRVHELNDLPHHVLKVKDWLDSKEVIDALIGDEDDWVKDAESPWTDEEELPKEKGWPGPYSD